MTKISVLLLVWLTAFAQKRPKSTDDNPISGLFKVYGDESHCLVGPEILTAAAKPISCYCRDALADAHYVYQTYLITGKDRNLNGTYLRLVDSAEQECGKGIDVVHHTSTGDWRWNGPEVTRTYPPDRIIEHIRPDSKGFRTVPYEVWLTYRDAKGRVTKVEKFSATERLGPDFKTLPCPPGAVCPK